MPRDEGPTKEQLFELAQALGKRENFTMPYYNEKEAVWKEHSYAGPFMLVTYRDDPTDFDDGHGCRQIGSAEWAESAEHAVRLAREALRYKGWYRLSVFDVVRGERCELEFGVRLKYKALATLTAAVGEGCFDNAPALGGDKQEKRRG